MGLGGIAQKAWLPVLAAASDWTLQGAWSPTRAKALPICDSWRIPYADSLSSLAAKRMGVSKTVAEVENIDYIGMAESLDIGTVINKKMIAASHIYQMMLDADVSNVKCLTFANADVAEFTVPENAKITKNKVKDLGLPKGTTIGGLIRNGEGVLVTGDTLIQAGDHVVVFCLSMMIKKIEKYFN